MEADFDPSGLVVELGMVVSARDEAGAACGPIGGSCGFEVLSAFEFGPASSAGLAVGDHIVAIDGTPTEGLSAAEATALLGGSPGTSTVVSIDREGTILERTMTREDIRTAPSEIDFLGDGVVYMRLNDFSQQAAVDLGFFLQLPEVEAASGMVLDLRDNPGGLVLAAQGVASQFLDDGLVMIERGKDYVEEIPVVDGGLATDRLRLVVLVNRASASAAEIVAAVLQERGRAVIVGETTFGKNLVQSYQTARDGGMIGITIARWETPEGLDIGIRGLQPDVVVAADPATGGDEVLEAGLASLEGLISGTGETLDHGCVGEQRQLARCHQDLRGSVPATENDAIPLHDGGVDQEGQVGGKTERRDPTDHHPGEGDRFVRPGKRQLPDAESVTDRVIHVESCGGQGHTRSHHPDRLLGDDHDCVGGVRRVDTVVGAELGGVGERWVAGHDFVARSDGGESRLDEGMEFHASTVPILDPHRTARARYPVRRCPGLLWSDPSTSTWWQPVPGFPCRAKRWGAP
jgi:carboxyl-terminal processing protease